MTQPPVPGKAEYIAALIFWQGKAHDLLALSADSVYSSTTGIQYDGQLGKMRAKAYDGNNAAWDAKITKSWSVYNDYVNNVASPAGGIATFLMHLDGMYQDYINGTVRSPTSVTNVTNILNNGSYMVSDSGDVTGSTMVTQEFSRETAYVGYAHLIAFLMGITQTSPRLTRLSVMYTLAMGHCAIWYNNTGTYCRPFMAAITSKFLIKYHGSSYATAQQKTDIVTALTNLGDYLWNTCYKDTDGAWGAGKAMLYADRFVVDSDDIHTALDLNAVIAPMYAWLWYQTGIETHKTRHNTLFQYGIPVYSGSVQLSGSYMGTPSAPALKQVNQQAWWAPDGIVWAESDPLVSPSTPSPTISHPWSRYDTSFFGSGKQKKAGGRNRR
jgi:hypothetical protein